MFILTLSIIVIVIIILMFLRRQRKSSYTILNTSDVITRLNQEPHLNGGIITEIDYDDGVWEIDVVNGPYKYELEMDARTGHILKIKYD